MNFHHYLHQWVIQSLSQFYINATSPLDSNVVINILLKPDQDQINEYPPAKPRGGEVFLVQSAKQDDWKCDQYIWINDSKSTPKCSENGVKLI
jgi:hypothetical protein